MTREQLQSWVKSNLYRTDGSPIRARFSLAWFERNHPRELERIVSTTSFLGSPKSFQARIYCIVNEINERPSCLRCGSPTKWHQIHRRFMTYCSKDCSNKSTAKKGSEAHIISEKVRSKARNTLLRKYGVDNYFKTKEFQDKFITKFGRRSGSQLSLKKEAFELLNSPEKLKELHHRDGLSHTEIASLYSLSPAAVHKAFARHNIEVLTHPTSMGQKEVLEYIRDELGYKDAIERERSILKNLELDIYIPSKKIAIEYHGAYWHSSRFKLPGQHKYKLKACETHGIRLLQFFDFEWNTKKEIVKSMIQSVLGGNEVCRYAKSFQVREVDGKEAGKFFDQNHLQGNKGGTVCYGLFWDEELITAMYFGKPRFSKNFDYELVRYATKIGYRVVGGASRIFKNFVTEYNPDSVVTYADLRYSQGNVYAKIGFELSHYSHINYYYLINGRLESRMNWQKKDIARKLPKFDPSLSEKKNMEMNGYYRVYDCGHACYIWSK